MRRPTQGCLFESDRPHWRELLTSTRNPLRQLMQQLLLETARRAEVTKSENEVSDDESKITSEHLARKAIVCVRQSSGTQVRENLESQRRQYALVEHARSLGFGDVELIDEDTGQSGSTLAGRSGFQRLMPRSL